MTIEMDQKEKITRWHMRKNQLIEQMIEDHFAATLKKQLQRQKGPHRPLNDLLQNAESRGEHACQRLIYDVNVELSVCNVIGALEAVLQSIIAQILRCWHIGR
jgi:hypothetical protein